MVKLHTTTPVLYLASSVHGLIICTSTQQGCDHVGVSTCRSKGQGGAAKLHGRAEAAGQGVNMCVNSMTQQHGGVTCSMLSYPVLGLEVGASVQQLQHNAVVAVAGCDHERSLTKLWRGGKRGRG